MSEVKKELLGGVFYTAITKYSGLVLNVLVTAVLARLITPEDFGVVAIATVLINFFSMLSDMGIGPAIIQNQELSHNDYRSIFTLTVYIGLLLTAVFFVSAGAVSSFYDNEKLVIIIQLFSLSIFFHCVDIVPNNLLKKAKRFRFIAVMNIIVQFICGVLAVTAAFVGFGIYALLIQPILASIFLFVWSYKQYVTIPVIKIDWMSIRKIFNYSSYQFMFSFINYFSRNLDKLVVGRFFGITELGYYEKSYRLMMMPVGNLSHVITPAIQPIFADYQNDKNWLFEKSMKLFRVLTFIGFPLSVFLFFSSEELVILFFGPQWYGAVPVFKILSLSVGLQIIYSPQGAFFQSANAVKEMFYCGIITALLNVVAVILGCFTFHSLTVLSWLIVFSYTLAFFQVYFVMTRRVFHQHFNSFLKILIEPVVASIIMSVFFFFVDEVTDGLALSLRTIIKISLFIALMGLYETQARVLKALANRK